MSAVGFDIGTENSCIAVIKSGVIEILDNEYSLRLTPTYIGFNDKCRDIGNTAKSKLITNLENSVFNFKRILGKKHDDVETKDELSYWPLNVCELPSGNIGIQVRYLNNNTVFSVEQLMAMILTKLKTITESKLENKIRDCVIAVPVYYTDAQRRAMLDAVNIAGLNAVKLMNESSAIALTYGFFKQNLSDDLQNVVFIDFGKSCLTVTACTFSKDKAKILGYVWDHVGGRDFDNALVKYFIDVFKSSYNIDVMKNKKALIRLIMECERLKKIMSVNPLEITLQIECFIGNLDVSGKMKRELFEKLSEQVLNKVEFNFNRLLTKIQLSTDDIHSVEIVGGSSRIPAVKELIKNVFGRRPNETLNQDEAVARGCALQCGMLLPNLKSRNYVLDDIPSYAVKIIWKNKQSDDEILELISHSDKIPCSKLVTISMSKPFIIKACYVDSREELCEIGSFILYNIPEDIEKSGFMKVKIKACLDNHGIFNIKSTKVMKAIDAVQAKDEALSTTHNIDADVTMTDKDDKISSPEKLANEVQAVCSVKSYDLSIESQVSGLTKLRTSEFIQAEQSMICKDDEEKETADARNALEEFLYDVRGKLKEKFREFVLEENKNALLQSLNKIEEWLEDNQDLEAAEYFKKLKDLRSSFDPIAKRFDEWQQRSSVISDYNKALQQGLDAINNCMNRPGSTDVSSDEDIKNLRSIWEESKMYLDEYVETVSGLQKTDDVPITVNELWHYLLEYKSKFQNLFSEMQRKWNAAPKVPDSSAGDGCNLDTENSNSNSLPNDASK